ncbi:hypothetical protein [Myroides sp. WP-1]|uniref:hypothetical protein n=1 Tax=Myroides sp. WP-1 TaxID=2759944 RepID=UPI0015F7D5DA|nr:hypothetical protein [Myroides sp. WP-1]MBB1138202.1 hypothetical protein [Myroides sp. WP-1]
MKKNYKTLLKAKDMKLPQPELVEKLLTYSKFWSQLALSDFMETKLKASKVN